MKKTGTNLRIFPKLKRTKPKNNNNGKTGEKCDDKQKILVREVNFRNS